MRPPLADLEMTLGYHFRDITLLETACTHRSYLNEHKSAREHNERLEFLGDAVLELVVTEYLYATYPDKPEGDLTMWRSALVRGDHLASIATELALGQHLRLARGEEKSGGREKAYLLANMVEAVIGAMHLDGGYEPVKAFLHRRLIPRLPDIIAAGLHIDAKSRLQELAQEKENITPEYRVVAESGPDHAKEFTIGAFFAKRKVGEGKGSNKQTAEQAAARNALGELRWS